MAARQRSAVPVSNRPTAIGRTCKWKVPKILCENEGLAILGLLQRHLKGGATNCVIDFHEVEWADPQPLLCLGLVIAESQLDPRQVVWNLGSTSEKFSTEGHRIFLKFLAQQGFLTAFAEFGQFRCEGKTTKTPQDVLDLRLRLSTQLEATHYKNVDCIFARLLRVDEFQENQSGLQHKVEELLREAHDRAIESAFGGEPFARDMLFQKLRKLLYELLLNVAEHSHLEHVRTYVGVYARICEAKPPIEADAKDWVELFERGMSTYGQAQFSPNPYAEWLDLFVCDVGIGLTSRIADWKAPDDVHVANDLRQAKLSRNPLESIAYRLFRDALSRHPRHDASRTAVTGLQHLGHLLSVGGDHCRLYTQNGCWVGGPLPWNLSYSRKDIRDSATSPEYAGLVPVSGTAYAFSIQPNHTNVATACRAAWVEADDHTLRAIRDALRSKAVFDPAESIEFYDRRTEPNCLPPSSDELPSDAPLVIVLRPPRLTSKQDISKWLTLVAGNPHDRPKRPVRTFILADLTPFQTLTFRELLLNVNVHSEARLDLYLVSDHWTVSCVSTSLNQRMFIPSDEKARNFACVPDPQDLPLFWIGSLAVLLRQMDSEIFWSSVAEQASIFFNRAVLWSESDKSEVLLQRYLDFPQALADPVRYRACRRALRRCLALFPDHEAVGADDLVASLVKDALVGTFGNAGKTSTSVLVVGSVAVTAETVNQLVEPSEGEAIHMMIHRDWQGVEGRALLAAMLWVSELPVSADLPPSPAGTDSERPWRRIPNSPYIAPLGEQSISILRYRRGKDDRVNFKAPFYGRTPEETYNDFQRLGVLKTGHWKYGSHHDLLTINTRLAFHFSFLELGPLYGWIRDQFGFFFSPRRERPARAQFLIYPSHPVTDSMLNRIRQESGFADVLPQGGMIPVKFLGVHTVSPLLASHLVAYEIEKLVSSRGWGEWSAVVLDDGAVSGKHLRELSQFLQGLNAKTVYTLALLDRTGLPAQEPVLDKYFERHRRFWRWDVPTLGNGRDCPLCQALAIVQTYARRLDSDRQQVRLAEWVSLWKTREVESQWHRGGLPPMRLSPPLKVTFGVDVKLDGSRTEKDIFLPDSTSATSILLELTRLTTRADTTIKKAESIESADPDAAIEMITAQLLLFLDELTLPQKRERFMKLLKLLWSVPISTQAMALAGLCITLADHNVLRVIWTACRTEHLPTRRIGNLDAILALNILRSRYAFLTGESYKLAHDAGEIEQHNYIMLGGDGCHREVVRSFLEFYRNPMRPGSVSTHTTKMRERLVDLSNVGPTAISGKTFADAAAVLNDMQFVEQIMRKVRAELIAKVPEVDLCELVKHMGRLEQYVSVGRSTSEPRSGIVDDIRGTAMRLARVLYGDSGVPGLISRVGEQFFQHYDGIDEIDNRLIGKIVRSVRNRWPETIGRKATVPRNSDAIKRWRTDEDGGIVLPSIACSRNPQISKLWLYCDSYVQLVLEEVLGNVFHATRRIRDPWKESTAIMDAREPEAHLWWRLEVSEDYAMLTTVNSSANREIGLKQTVNISGMERAGGSIEIDIAENGPGGVLAYVTVKIPRHSAFIKERS